MTDRARFPQQLRGMQRARIRRRCWHVIVALWAAMPLTAFAQLRLGTDSLVVRGGTLSFTGHATVGGFVGSTSTVTGVVAGELPNVRGWVEAPVATLNTHNDHRDRDLRASMEADRFPTLRFDLDRATTDGARAARPDSIALLLHGTLAIHGVSRTVDLPATLVQKGDTVNVIAWFPLDLADYHIGGLTKMFGLLRMQRNIEVRAELQFVGDVLKAQTAGTP